MQKFPIRRKKFCIVHHFDARAFSGPKMGYQLLYAVPDFISFYGPKCPFTRILTKVLIGWSYAYISQSCLIIVNIYSHGSDKFLLGELSSRYLIFVFLSHRHSILCHRNCYQTNFKSIKQNWQELHKSHRKMSTLMKESVWACCFNPKSFDPIT